MGSCSVWQERKGCVESSTIYRVRRENRKRLLLMQPAGPPRTSGGRPMGAQGLQR